MTETELLRLAASLEQASEHPLAASLLRAAKEQGIALSAVTDFQALPGRGIRGTVEGRSLLVGSEVLLRESGVVVPAVDSGAHGKLYFAVDGRWQGSFLVADAIKPEARRILTRLREMGFQLVMLSGDSRQTTASVAWDLGIEDFLAELAPQNKYSAIKELQKSGSTVVFAGDGINDAPALAVADAGLAMGNGTDVAIQSAGITLLHGNLASILHALSLSRAMMRTIRQNLFFAFIYNVVGVAIAAGVLHPWLHLQLSPMVAAAAMSFSSVSVIANSLRLRGVTLD